MKVITDYQVAYGKTPAALASAVNAAISRGYEPFGSIAINSATGDMVQAMIQYVIRG